MPRHDEQQCNGDTTGDSTPQQAMEQLDNISVVSSLFPFFFFLALVCCSQARPHAQLNFFWTSSTQPAAQ